MWYKSIVKPVLFRMDPEDAHHLAMGWLQVLSRNPAWLSLLKSINADTHRQGTTYEVFGIRFPNRVGLAAGFDKNLVALPAWAALGFGFVEGGTVTALEQPGNPRPRLFRRPEVEGIINRMGFNNDGAEKVAKRLDELKLSGNWPEVPVGINLGKSKVTELDEAALDYQHSFKALREFGDYFVMNVSSPNTPGLRSLQTKEALGDIVKAIQEVNPENKPLLVKIAPDLEEAQIAEVVEFAESVGLAGIIATNTTLDHSSVAPERDETGGLSGKPVREKSTEIVRFITKRSSLPVIACGGISDAASGMEKLEAGASLLQIYTGFIYRGPGLIKELVRATRDLGHLPTGSNFL